MARGNSNPTLNQLCSGDIFKQICNSIFPVGIIIGFNNNTNPNTQYGGTWIEVGNDTFLATKGIVAVGNYGGSNNAIVVTHNHDITDNGHTHSYTYFGPTGGSGAAGMGTWWLQDNAYTTGKAKTGITINNNGSSGTNKNMPKYLAVRYWYRTELY